MRQLLLQTQILLALIQSSPGVEQMNSLPLLTADELTANATATTGPAGQPAIQVVGNAESTTTVILKCPAPSVSTHQYVVRGQVKYEGVTGDGYLELWNDFGSKGQFFSRSLA